MRSPATLYDQMQLLACNVAVKDAVVNVTAATGKLAAEPFSQSEVAWHDWQLPQPTSDPLLSIVCFCFVLQKISLYVTVLR